MSIAVLNSAVPTTRVTTGTSTEYETAVADAASVRTGAPLCTTRVGAAERRDAERVVAATKPTAEERSKRAFMRLSPVKRDEGPHGKTKPLDTRKQFPVHSEKLHWMDGNAR